MMQLLSVFLGVFIGAAAHAVSQRDETNAVKAEAVAAGDWVYLEVKLEEETNATASKVAPPPGIYPFHRGDHVLLYACGGDGASACAAWSGDISVHGPRAYLVLDADKTVLVRFESATDAIVEADSWFDVPEHVPVYAFLGGGNLYGWFVAARDPTVGAAITHLTHQDYLRMPFIQIPGFNFEHIFSDAPEDSYRANYTPRTDVMRFSISAANTVRVQWPMDQSTWQTGCEATYCFSGGDAVDIAFSVNLGQGEALPETLYFMWATYQNMSKDRAIYFPTSSNGETRWERFGPTAVDGIAGGSIASAAEAPAEDKPGANVNQAVRTDLYYSTPVYYGMLEPQPNTMFRTQSMAFVAMFEPSSPVRFTLWNWGNPPSISAWDWQYVLHRPKPEERYCFNTRVLLTPFAGEHAVFDAYASWRQQANATQNPIASWPDASFYWSPRLTGFDLLSQGKALENRNWKRAIDAYTLGLHFPDTQENAAAAIDALYHERQDISALMEQWSVLCAVPDLGATPYVHLGMAQIGFGDYESACVVLTRGKALFPENAAILHQLGKAMVLLGQLDMGLHYYRQAVMMAPDLVAISSKELGALAETASRSGAYDCAQSIYETAMAIAPADLWHRVRLAETLEALGEDQLALEQYVYVLKTAPESPYAAHSLDKLLFRIHTDEQHTNTWKDIVQLHPDAVIPKIHLTKALYRQQEYEEIVRLLSEPALSVPPSAEMHLYYGCARIRCNDSDVGIKNIGAALADQPDLASLAGELVSAIADEAVQEHDYVRAEQWHRYAATINPDELWHTIRLAELLERRQENEQALRLYLCVLHDNPDFPGAAKHLDDLLMRLNRGHERLELWQKIRALFADALVPTIHVGKALYDQKQYEEAQTLFQELEPRAAADAGYNLYYGCLLVRLADDVGGCARIDAALVLAPELASLAGEMVASIAEEAVQNQDYPRAERWYRYATTLAPDDLWHVIHLAEALEKQGNDQGAFELYNRVLNRAPEAPYTARKLDALLLRGNRAEVRKEYWRKCSETHPEAIIPALYLSQALCDMEKYEEAFNLLATLTPAVDGNAQYHFIFGVTLLYLGRIEEGLQRLENAVRLDAALASDAREALETCARALESRNDVAQAKRLADWLRRRDARSNKTQPPED